MKKMLFKLIRIILFCDICLSFSNNCKFYLLLPTCEGNENYCVVTSEPHYEITLGCSVVGVVLCVFFEDYTTKGLNWN